MRLRPCFGWNPPAIEAKSSPGGAVGIDPVLVMKQPKHWEKTWLNNPKQSPKGVYIYIWFIMFIYHYISIFLKTISCMQRKFIYIYGLNLSYIYIYLYLENIKLQNDVWEVSRQAELSARKAQIKAPSGVARTWPIGPIEYWNILLVGGWATPMKNMKSVGISIPNLWKNRKCSKYWGMLLYPIGNGNKITFMMIVDDS